MLVCSLAGSFSTYDILAHDSRTYTCPKIDLINIRGANCTDCSVWLLNRETEQLHIDSFYDKGCDFRAVDAEACGYFGEDNFGYYGCINSAFRCSSSPSSTTQWWIGVG